MNRNSLDEIKIIKQRMKEVYLNYKTHMVAMSGGKDSSLVMQLLCETLEDMEPEERIHTVHIICADTGVETPEMTAYQYRCLEQIKRYAAGEFHNKGKMPFVVHMVKPQMKSRFFYKLLGRGTSIPLGNVRNRWCTSHLKLLPMQNKLKEILNAIPMGIENDEFDVLLYTGVRNEESARRRRSIAAIEDDATSYFAEHPDMPRIKYFHPIKFLTSDEVFFELMDRGTLSYGIDVEEMTIQYGEEMLECGIKTSANDIGSACSMNGARSGCWLCGVVSEDKMLKRLIAEGKNSYQFLLDWKTLVVKMRNDCRYRSIKPRPVYNKILKSDNLNNSELDIFQLCDEEYQDMHYYEIFNRASDEGYIPGGISFEGRYILLEYLLYAQEKSQYILIEEEEIEAILDAWYETEGVRVSRNEIVPKDFNYDGELVLLPDMKVNKQKTRNTNPIFYVDVDYPFEEGELFSFLKERQRITRKSYFCFPSCYDNGNFKVVWNKLKFIICSSNIRTIEEARKVIFNWLGWTEEPGTMNKKYYNLGINQLLLSAIREGISTNQRNKQIVNCPAADVQIQEEECGQISLFI